MNEWKALAGRITLFPAPSTVALPSALDLYAKVWTGTTPTSFQASSNPLVPSVAQGKTDEFGTHCSTHASRVDFTLSAIGPDKLPEVPKLFVIENSQQFYTELKRICVLAAGLIANPVLRVAIFLHLTSTQSNVRDANAALLKIIPNRYRLTLNEEEEFSLQLNEPGTSKRVENLKINHITKWSVDRFQVISMQLPTAGAPAITAQSGIPTHVHEFLAASITFDHNNAPVPAEKPLLPEQQSSLLLEGLAAIVDSINSSKLRIEGFRDD